MTDIFKNLLKGSYYYETKSVSKTRKSKVCSSCNNVIPSGSSHTYYVLFCDEFYNLDVCNVCKDTYKEEIKEMCDGKYDSYS